MYCSPVLTPIWCAKKVPIPWLEFHFPGLKLVWREGRDNAVNHNCSINFEFLTNFNLVLFSEYLLPQRQIDMDLLWWILVIRHGSGVDKPDIIFNQIMLRLNSL